MLMNVDATGKAVKVTTPPPNETPRDERSSEDHWRRVANRRPNWGALDNPALSPEQAETERRVFEAAKQLERASQYGIPANAALEEFERAVKP